MVLPHLRGLFRDASGQVAIIFALVALPVLVMTGLALDAGRQLSSNQHVQIATDFASLAAARAMEDASLSDSDVIAVAETTYMAQLETAYGDLDCDTPEVTVNRAEREVKVQGTCDLPTVFGAQIMPRDTISVMRASAAEPELTGLEVALIVDLSESVSGLAEAAIVEAAQDFAETLVSERNNDRVRMSLIPFATAINAGIYGNRAMGRPDLDDRFGDGTDIVCIRERDGVEAFTDERPAPGLWVQELTHGAFRCPENPVVPLSNDPSHLQTQIGTYAAVEDSGSAGHVALAWAWYSLSPKWRSIWPSGSDPVPYGTPNTTKAVLVLTDGGFNEWYDWDAALQARPRMEALHLCDGMRDAGIEIYVIGFDVLSNMSNWLMPRSVLLDCAGDEQFYFETDDINELRPIFDEIATRLKRTTITE